MSFFLKVLCGLLFLSDYCLGANPEEQEASNPPRRMSSRPPSLSMIFPIKRPSLEEQNKAKLDTFHRERAALVRRIHKTDRTQRWQHVVAVDYDGVMDPECNIHSVEEAKRYPQGWKLYKKLKKLGATVLISSARDQPETVVQSLRRLGMDNLPEHMQEERVDGYEIKLAGNVISARLQDRPAFPGSDYYRSKRAAALWFYKRTCQERGITGDYPEPLTLDLIDDQKSSIQTFMEEGADRLFDINYPAPGGITFPPSWLFSTQ